MKFSFFIIGLLLSMPMAWSQNAITHSTLEWKEILQGRTINCFERDLRGFIWIGTEDGLYRYDGHQFMILKHDPMADSTLLEDKITSLKVAPDGDLWVGYASKGIDCISLKNMTIQHYQSADSANNTLPNSAILDIYIDKQGDLWLGHLQQCLSRLSPHSGVIKRYEQLPGIEETFSERDKKNYNTVHQITESSTGELWLATQHGLYKLDSSRQNIIEIPTPQDPGTNYPDLVMQTGLLVGDSILYLGLWGSYFRSYNIRSGEWTVYNSMPLTDVFRRPCVNAIVSNSPRKLWFTDGWHGLYSFDLTNQNFQREAIPNRANLNFFNLFMDPEGNFWMFANDRCLLGHPNFQDRDQKERVEISSVKSSSDKVSYGNLESITLVHPNTDLRISFSAFEYFLTHEVEYSVKLDGYNQDWVELGNTPNINYENLPGGEYTFLVRSRLPNKEWSETTSMRVLVKEPFWLTKWFIFFVILILLIMVYLLYQWRIKEIRKMEETKSTLHRRIAEEEMRALRAQMNPHFIFNALNSINRQIVKSDTKTASLYLTRFARLMRLTLDNSEGKLVSLYNEIEALKLYIEMESLRFDHSFHYSIEISDEIDMDVTQIPPLIMQPFVENAIWHGLLNLKDRQGNLWIRLAKSGNQIRISIEDNGVGRKKAAEKTNSMTSTKKSMGMRLTSERIEMIASEAGQQATVEVIDLMDSEGNASGTLINLNIPHIKTTHTIPEDDEN